MNKVKLISIRVLLLIACLIYSNAIMAYDFKVNGLCYKILSESNHTVELTWEAVGKGYEGEIVVPNKVSYGSKTYNVIGIGKCAFVKVKDLDNKGECNNWDRNNSLTKVILSADISYIDDYSFAECVTLDDVVFPSKLTSIGNEAFYACHSISDIDLSATETVSIGDMSFGSCSNLKKISFPSTIQTIGEYVFASSSSLTTIQVDASNPYFCVNDNVIYNKNMTSVLVCAPGKSGEYTISEGVKTIANTAFQGCRNLRKINFPQTVTYIGKDAFQRCTGLQEISLPDGIQEIQLGAFRECLLKSVTLPSSLTYIGSEAFCCEPLEKIVSLITNPFPIDKYVFGSEDYNNIYNRATVNVPLGSLSKYQQTEGWNLFKNIFETKPTYTLSIKTIGNGSASYDGTTIRGKTSSFTINEGTTVKISITPDNGYRIKSVKENNTVVTSYVSNGIYSINSLSRNTTLEVEFEAIPPKTYTLSITASDNGSASYSGTTIRSKTSSFTVNEGSSATISFTPDDGYQIKSVKVNGSIVSVTNSQYTISSISGNTSVEVEFEAIPQTTCIVSIKASGNGSVSYDGETIRNETRNYTVNIGTSITVYFHADEGYRLKSLKVNNISISGSQYCTTTINRNTTIEVEYEAIPTTNYTLSITATGNGSVSYDGSTIRSRTSTFKVNEGANVTLSISPDNGNRLKSVKINDSDVTNNVSNNSYTISNISKDTSVEVEFAEELKSFMSDGISYSVSSYDDKTIIVVGGDFGRVLDVPATISYQDHNWKVIGIDNVALIGHPELAAIIWNPTAGFTLDVSNPNLLLYVTSANYAPSSITNVIVNNTAEKIILTDASSGNDFYCPKAFTANSINYTHNYVMTTGIGESRGWETIALPFDVQKIIHSGKGEITPFVNWKSDDSKKPFWLMTYGVDGWTEANSIKANTPYIISMPNHQNYKSDFRLSGSVTFSAENITVSKSDDYQTGSYNGNTFVPNFANIDNSGYYTLNVNNDYVTYSGGSAEGSRFVVNLRPVHPFEAYMTSTSSTRSIGIDEGMATGIMELISAISDDGVLKIYNLNGQLVKIEEGGCLDEVMKNLPAGVYIVNGKKMIIR